MDSGSAKQGTFAPSGKQSPRTFAAPQGNAWGAKSAANATQSSGPSQPAKKPSQPDVSKFQIDDVSSSDDEERMQEAPDISRLEASIFGDYELGVDEGGETGVEKIRDLLISGQSGATRCLICLEKIRATDPIWDCQDSCYAIMHLLCIQSWARQSIAAAGLRNPSSDPLPSNAPTRVAKPTAEVNWHCPKCRHDYPPTNIPSEYRCFCSKERDPGFDPWHVPHTCGETCGRALGSDCGHVCRLLCHPGPCPPCPQLVTSHCHCGASEDVRRCGRREFACGGTCRRRLACGKHQCKQPCHPGECPPCPEAGVYSCRCGRVEEKRTCAQRDFSCGKKCGRQLACGRHVCERLCHGGKCGECPLAGARVCPCGKTDLGELPCDVPTPTCGATCEKMLACGRHACPERCHVGPCVDTCRVMTDKACRCGSLRKEVPCFQDLQCERRCQRQRSCGRHACKRRCCDGDCPPCPDVCFRRLRCGNHKCPAPCHDGPCAPCPVTVQIACACGGTVVTVPCGTERQVKPPWCAKPCRIPRHCRHAANAPLHRCHYGNCPPCTMTCREELGCGHECPESCHGAHPLPGPIYTLRQTRKQKKVQEQKTLSEGSPCPPCQQTVTVTCLGGHSHRQVACSAAGPFACDQPCGNALACGNHACGKPCHVVLTSASADVVEADVDCNGASGRSAAKPSQETVNSARSAVLPNGSDPLSSGNGTTREAAKAVTVDEGVPVPLPPPEPCETCAQKCSKPPVAPCTHNCPRGCHPGPCPPCTKLVRRTCHCEAGTALAIECAILAAAESNGGDAPEALLSCGGRCDRRLPTCAHTCQAVCHAGVCPNPELCRKKVNVRCPCRRQKKDWPCTDVRAAQAASGSQSYDLLTCDKDCQRLAERKKTGEAKKNQPEVREEESPKKTVEGPPRGRRRGRRRDEGLDTRQGFLPEGVGQLAVRALWWALYVMIAFVVCYVIVKIGARIDHHYKTAPRQRPRRYYQDL